MKKTLRVRFVLLPAAFAALGYILSWAGVFKVLSESGESDASLLCNIFVYASAWPCFSLGLRDPEIFRPESFTINVAGWGIVGLAVALISLGEPRRLLNKLFDVTSP